MSDRRLVLVAVDHASDVERTIRAALDTGEVSGADIDVIQVAPYRATYVDEHCPTPEAHGHRTALANVEQWLASIAKSAPDDGVRVRSVTLRGAPEQVIPAYAQLHQAALIVVEHDYGSSRFWRHTGIVDALARESPVPVLALPKRLVREGGDARLRRIVAPVDFSVASAVALRTGIDLARRRGARLTLVHALSDLPRQMIFSSGEAGEMSRLVPERADVIADQLRHQADDLGADDVDTAAVTGAADRAILDAAEQHGADMIVMGIPRRPWVDRVAFGSTLRRVLRGSTVPVLIAPVTAGAHPWPMVEEVNSRAWTNSLGQAA